MAPQVGSIYVKLELDDKDFDKSLSNAQTKAEKSGGFLSRALEFATGGAILGGLSAVKDKVLDVAKGMIAGNAEFETYQTQFGVLLGSTDEAKKRLDELAKFGASTPFELPELVKADKTLQGFGIHSKEMLKIVGDVAAGTGTSFKDMALLMGKFSAGATGEVISRFAELGITNRKQLAEMGLQFSKSGELLSPLPEAMAVVQQLMKDKYGGMMEAQSQTFSGMVSNLQDWVGSTIRTLGAPIFDVVKDKLGVLLAFLSAPETMTALNTFATSLATGIGVAMDFIANTAIPGLIKGWTDIQPAVKTAMDIFNVIASVMTTTVIPALTQLWDFIQNNIKPLFTALVAVLLSVVVPAFVAWSTAAIAAAASTVAALAPVLLPLAAIGTAVYLLYQAWDTNFLGIRDTLTDFWNNYGLPIFNTVQEWLAVNLPIAIQTLSDFWNTVLLPALTAVWNFISTYVIPIIIEIIQVHFVALQVMLQSVANFWNTILLPAIKAVWSFLHDYIIPLIAAIVNVTFALFELAIRNVTTQWNIMKGAFLAAWDFIQGYLMPAIKLLTNAAIGPLGDMAKSVGGAFNNTFKPSLTSIADAIISVVLPAFHNLQGLIDGVKSAISGIGSVIQGAISWLHKLADAIRSLPSMPSGNGVPGFATGTNFAPGGLALVGERGPELVDLPKGSRVHTANETQHMLNNSSNAGNTTIFNVNYRTEQSSVGFANDISMLQLMTKGA